MMSVGTQIQLLVTLPAAKEMISIIQEIPIKVNTLKITRNLKQTQVKWKLPVQYLTTASFRNMLAVFMIFYCVLGLL